MSMDTENWHMNTVECYKAFKKEFFKQKKNYDFYVHIDGT